MFEQKNPRPRNSWDAIAFEVCEILTNLKCDIAMKSAAPKLPGRHCYEDYDIAMKSAAPKLQGAAARMPFDPGLRPPQGPWPWAPGPRARVTWRPSSPHQS